MKRQDDHVDDSKYIFNGNGCLEMFHILLVVRGIIVKLSRQEGSSGYPWWLREGRRNYTLIRANLN